MKSILYIILIKESAYREKKMRIQFKIISPELSTVGVEKGKAFTFIMGIFQSDRTIQTGQLSNLSFKKDENGFSVKSAPLEENISSIMNYSEWNESTDKCILQMGFKPKSNVESMIFYVNTDIVENVLNGELNGSQGYFLGTIGGNQEDLTLLSKQVLEAKIEDGFSPLYGLGYDIQHVMGNHLTIALKLKKWGFSEELGVAVDPSKRIGLRTYMDFDAFDRYKNELRDFRDTGTLNKNSLIMKDHDYLKVLNKLLHDDKYFELSQKQYYTKAESDFINEAMNRELFNLLHQDDLKSENDLKQKIKNKL